MTGLNKVAVVTGGRRGIGRACALALKDAGYRVVVVAQSPTKGDMPKDIDYVRADLSSRENRRGLMSDITELVGPPDVLVNNAGIAHSYSAMDYPLGEWEDILEVNLTAPFDLARQAVHLGAKRIINIASISAFNGARNISGYAASKHALIGLTKCLSNEWAPLGVTVNNIAPGFIQTDMLTFKDEQHMNNIIGRIPAGRIGTPQDVVGALLFLVSDAAQYVTGTTIVVDGGWLGR